MKNGTALAEERHNGWALETLNDADFARFSRLIYEAAGISLRETKQCLLVARLGPRLRELGLESFSDYYQHLTADTSGRELTIFINRITTNKTSFFRESHHFEFLTGRVVPQARGKRLRIWSAACSSGEEPYSIAMALRDATGGQAGWDIRIVASDIDTEVLARAEAGVYGLDALREIPEHRVRAHFLRGYGEFAGMAQVRPELRAMVTFRRINLVEANLPLSEGLYDAIFCRNVIIYFDRPTQQSLVERLAEHLKPNGYLFTGHSENLFWAREILTPVQPTIYRLPAVGEAR